MRHLCGRSGCRYAGKVAIHKLTSFVLQGPVIDLVLRCVDELDVPDGVRGLFDQTRDAFLPLTAQADRPVDRRAFADPARPFAADLCEEVRPTVGRSRTIGAVYNDDRSAR